MTRPSYLPTEEEMDYKELELKLETRPNLIYVKEPDSFSEAYLKINPNMSDIQQVRDWKNKVIEIRNRHKGTPLYAAWDSEAKRILEFLNKDCFKNI